MEAEYYGDIVQENFMDSYHNLTYKGIMAFKWLSSFCSKAQFVLKVDDDMIVNSFNLLRHLKALGENYEIKDDHVIMCNLFKRMKVMRDPKSKWFLSEQDFKKDYFEKYCSGSAFLVTGDLIFSIYKKSLHMKFFWIDDYFITGLVPNALGYVKHRSLNSLYVLNPYYAEEAFNSNKINWITFAHLGKFRHNIDRLKRYWNIILAKNSFYFI
jgi:beta-1,3-galactosyltransferase 1